MNTPAQAFSTVIPYAASRPGSAQHSGDQPNAVPQPLLTNIPRPTGIPQPILANIPKPPPFIMYPATPMNDPLPGKQEPVLDAPLPPPSTFSQISTATPTPIAVATPSLDSLLKELSHTEEKVISLTDDQIKSVADNGMLLQPLPPGKGVPLMNGDALEPVERKPDLSSHKIFSTVQEDEYSYYLEKAEKKGTPEPLIERMEQIIKRIRVLEETQANYAVVDNEKRYLDYLIKLPFREKTTDTYDLQQAMTILDNSHYGMPKVKDRILDFLAVQQLAGESSRAPVLLFLGTPGLGKTTISRAIAKALGRKFIRISLAAMGDIHQIKGRSHNYPDAEPGAIIREICKAGVKNPVILFDEIDKMAGGVGAGEMMATFLEILDPEQNNEFWDHYLDYPFDLSSVMFLASANRIAEGEGPLIDRMELITLPDYTREDKMIIGERYLLPRVLEDTGLLPSKGYFVTLEQGVWDRLIDPFKWDSGMRTLKRALYSICNRIARESVETGKKYFTITGENLKDYFLA